MPSPSSLHELHDEENRPVAGPTHGIVVVVVLAVVVTLLAAIPVESTLLMYALPHNWLELP